MQKAGLAATALIPDGNSIELIWELMPGAARYERWVWSSPDGGFAQKA